MQKKTPSKVCKEEPTAIMPKKKKTPSKLVKEEPSAKKENLSTAPKHKNDEIDDIFASKKRKNLEAEASQKPEDVNGAPKKDKEKKKKKKMMTGEESSSRRRTNDGFKIFRSDELGINKPGSGFTPLCPFDCSCCF